MRVSHKSRTNIKASLKMSCVGFCYDTVFTGIGYTFVTYSFISFFLSVCDMYLFKISHIGMGLPYLLVSVLVLVHSLVGSYCIVYITHTNFDNYLVLAQM